MSAFQFQKFFTICKFHEATLAIIKCILLSILGIPRIEMTHELIMLKVSSLIHKCFFSFKLFVPYSFLFLSLFSFLFLSYSCLYNLIRNPVEVSLDKIVFKVCLISPPKVVLHSLNMVDWSAKVNLRVVKGNKGLHLLLLQRLTQVKSVWPDAVWGCHRLMSNTAISGHRVWDLFCTKLNKYIFWG